MRRILLAVCFGAAVDADPAEDLAFLKNQTRYILATCRLNTTDGTGTVLYSPNGDKPYYVGQWMRDSFYGFSGGWDVIPNASEACRSAGYILSRNEPGTGYMPQLVTPDGQGHSAQNGAPAALDCGPFAGLMLDFYAAGPGSSAIGGGQSFLAEHGAAVVAGLLATPLRSGLPWSDPAQPWVGYGFTDSITKTGTEMYSSVLLWDAATRLAADFAVAGDLAAAATCSALAAGVEASFSSAFWNASAGMFMAATGVESACIDIWGSAYAALSGLATPVQAASVAAYLASNQDLVFYAGQTREIPLPGYWQQSSSAPGTYQNGGFWGTPSHHTLVLLGQQGYKPLACSLLADAVANFRGGGAWEWIGANASHGSGAPSYVATIAGTYRAAKELQC
jgi:hypothetical protein